MADETDRDAKPDWPEEFDAPVANLGPPLAVHSFTGSALRRKLLYGIGGLILSVVLNFVYWVVLGMRFIEKYLLILLFGPGIYGIGQIVQSIRHRGLWVLRFPMGLLCWKRGTVLVFAWDEVETVILTAYHGTAAVMPFGPDMDDAEENWRALIPLADGAGNFQTIQLRLLRNDGEEIALPSSLEGFADLGERIQIEHFGRKWPAVWTKFQSGQSLEFDAITVNTGGLTHKTDTLPWPEFESAAVTQGQIVLRRAGRSRAWKSLPLRSLPNPHIFLWLLVRGQLPVPELPQE